MALKFVEQQRTVLYHDYLIYICGVEISPWVQSVDITFADRHGPGSADIVLTNPFDQWILTEKNLINNIYRNTSDRYSERAKLAIFNKKLAAAKLLAIGPTPAFLKRYSFGPGSLIFSRFDTVKIFLKNPYDHPEGDRWLPAFTGTVGNRPNTNNYVTGASSVSLQCFDIRAAMTGMRMALNGYQNTSFATIKGAQSQTVWASAEAGFFKDYYPTSNQRVGGTDNVLNGYSFVDMVSSIVTGQIQWVSPKVAGAKAVKAGQGTGFFIPGTVLKYANPSNKVIKGTDKITTLETWDNICLFGTKGNFWTRAECVQVGEDSFWQGGHTPFHGKMHFLIPAGGLQISDMIRTSFDGLNNIMVNPDWTDRFTLISRICQQIDYEWSVTGNGDIIFEFPMYDFMPKDFGHNSSIYIVDRHVESDNISEEEGEMISGMETQNLSAQLAKSAVETQLANLPGAVRPLAGQRDFPVRSVAFSSSLASKYGVRIASQSFTGVSTQKALDQITMIEFQKRLADCNKLSITFTYRPLIRPNRPVLHQEKNRVGKTTTVRLSHPSYEQVPTISVSLHCVKTPLLKDGKITYQTIAGGPSMTLSYNAIFEKADTIGNPDLGGVTINSQTTKDHQKK